MTEAVAAVARIPKGDFSIEPVSVEAPRVGEVLVKIAGVGLCHTDLIFRDQFAPYTLPAILGIGYMPEDRGLVPELTVEENILVRVWVNKSLKLDERLALVYRVLPELMEMKDRRALLDVDRGDIQLVDIGAVDVLGVRDRGLESLLHDAGDPWIVEIQRVPHTAAVVGFGLKDGGMRGDLLDLARCQRT